MVHYKQIFFTRGNRGNTVHYKQIFLCLSIRSTNTTEKLCCLSQVTMAVTNI